MRVSSRQTVGLWRDDMNGLQAIPQQKKQPDEIFR